MIAVTATIVPLTEATLDQLANKWVKFNDNKPANQQSTAFLKQKSKDVFPDAQDWGDQNAHFMRGALEQIARFDPQPKYKTTSRMLTWYSAGEFHDHDLKQVQDTLIKFLDLAKRRQIRGIDLNTASWGEVAQAVFDFENKEGGLSKRDKKKEERRALHTSGQAETIFSDDKFAIIKINTEEASKLYGRGTKWCTAGDNDNQFCHYKAAGKIAVILDRHKAIDGRSPKFQAYVSNDGYGFEFMGPANVEVPLFKIDDAFEAKHLDGLKKAFAGPSSYFWKRGYQAKVASGRMLHGLMDTDFDAAIKTLQKLAVKGKYNHELRFALSDYQVQHQIRRMIAGDPYPTISVSLARHMINLPEGLLGQEILELLVAHDELDGDELWKMYNHKRFEDATKVKYRIMAHPNFPEKAKQDIIDSYSPWDVLEEEQTDADDAYDAVIGSSKMKRASENHLATTLAQFDSTNMARLLDHILANAPNDPIKIGLIERILISATHSANIITLDSANKIIDLAAPWTAAYTTDKLQAPNYEARRLLSKLSEKYLRDTYTTDNVGVVVGMLTATVNMLEHMLKALKPHVSSDFDLEARSAPENRRDNESDHMVTQETPEILYVWIARRRNSAKRRLDRNAAKKKDVGTD